MRAAQKLAHRLSKSDYLSYLTCPQEFWLKVRQPLIFGAEEVTLEREHLRQQGYAVEALVKKLVRFQSSDSQFVEFQRTFQTEDFVVRSDIVVSDLQTGQLDIYEIKGAASVKEEHYEDVTFQRFVAEKSGFSVRGCFVITMDSDYIRQGEIEPEKLFSITDITAKTTEMLPTTEMQAREALAFLETDIEPSLVEYARSKHKKKYEFKCKVVSTYFPQMPEFTVFHVPNIYKPKLVNLLEAGILDLRDVPETFELSEKQRDYIAAMKLNAIDIKREKIAEVMDAWEYPLHFLDYETFQYAIPQFDGLRPFQQMCFQYSLHTIDRPGAEVRHSGKYLARRGELDPPRELARSLKEAMSGGIGTVFVWYESFEKTRNNEMAEMFPEHAEFFAEVNAKTFDLMKIFSDRLYFDPAFKGSNSIKKVLPALCPEAGGYDELDIGDGLTATIRWFRAAMWDGLDDEEREKTFADLDIYCEMDTRAMVEIYEVLRRACESV